MPTDIETAHLDYLAGACVGWIAKMEPYFPFMVVQIAGWMRLAGLRTWIDGVGNVHGVLEAQNSTVASIIAGSHYDTVRNAGNYDGVLGVVVSIAATKALLLSHLAPEDWQAGLNSVQLSIAWTLRFLFVAW
jgi:hypothetical protein